MPFPPPLPEQRAIAEALSDVDALLGALDRLIAKKRDLKQAAMQQLLTGQTRLPGFHGEWEVKRLRWNIATNAEVELEPMTPRLCDDAIPIVVRASICTRQVDCRESTVHRPKQRARRSSVSERR